jgi:hypothetical protein
MRFLVIDDRTLVVLLWDRFQSEKAFRARSSRVGVLFSCLPRCELGGGFRHVGLRDACFRTLKHHQDLAAGYMLAGLNSNVHDTPAAWCTQAHCAILVRNYLPGDGGETGSCPHCDGSPSEAAMLDLRGRKGERRRQRTRR